MHLYLPADHDTLPWIHMFGLFLLNINYWCANQTIMQRSLAAKSLREAQIGLMVGGVMKYVMAVIIIIPGLRWLASWGRRAFQNLIWPSLYGEDLPAHRHKRAYPMCTFASLMSTVDSTFNSLATLWSIDIYKGYLNKKATDQQLVQAGKQTILVTLITGITMGFILLYLKFENPDAAFTHTLNELRYYINCGIVVLICTAGFLLAPRHKLTFLLSVRPSPYTF